MHVSLIYSYLANQLVLGILTLAVPMLAMEKNEPQGNSYSSPAKERAKLTRQGSFRDLELFSALEKNNKKNNSPSSSAFTPASNVSPLRLTSPKGQSPSASSSPHSNSSPTHSPKMVVRYDSSSPNHSPRKIASPKKGTFIKHDSANDLRAMVIIKSTDTGPAASAKNITQPQIESLKRNKIERFHSSADLSTFARVNSAGEKKTISPRLKKYLSKIFGFPVKSGEKKGLATETKIDGTLSSTVVMTKEELDKLRMSFTTNFTTQTAEVQLNQSPMKALSLETDDTRIDDLEIGEFTTMQSILRKQRVRRLKRATTL